jgi:hypothetical protein
MHDGGGLVMSDGCNEHWTSRDARKIFEIQIRRDERMKVLESLADMFADNLHDAPACRHCNAISRERLLAESKVKFD